MLFETAKSDKKLPEVQFAFFNSPEYKMYKIKRFFPCKYQTCGENISRYTGASHS